MQAQTRSKPESQPSSYSSTNNSSLSSTANPFDPVTSINSGQAFLWEKIGDSWYGIDGENVLKFTVAANVADGKQGVVEFSANTELKEWHNHIFRLDDNFQKIVEAISHDKLLSSLVDLYPGLRLMRQNPEQCLFSFICASNTTIPMIRRMLKNLSKKFGTKVVMDGNEFFTFPSSSVLKNASIDDLRSCGTGFRSKAISAAAKKIAAGDLDLEFLKTKLSYMEAKQDLMKVYGVGNKIADCILLFSLEKVNSFPIDVWIARALARHYSWMYETKFSEKITSSQYETISEKIRGYFGDYSGYAQQYLYFHMRQSAGKKW